MAPPTPIDWQDAPSTLTPVNAANLKHHDAWMVEQVVAAQGSADAAAASAVEAAAPGDDQVAAFVADATPSATRAQVAAVVAGGVTTAEAYTDAQVAALQAQSASIEDLFVTTEVIAFGVSQGSFAMSRPVFVAPFPLTVTSVQVIAWAAAIAASDTNYWTVEARFFNASSADITFATKSTKVTGGEGFTLRRPWTFNAVTFTAGKTCAAGDVFNVAFTPSGTAPTIAGVMLVTVGYRPL